MVTLTLWTFENIIRNGGYAVEEQHVFKGVDLKLRRHSDSVKIMWNFNVHLHSNIIFKKLQP
jgi:hypothetical protein